MGGDPNSRVIHEAEAARAMQVVDQAGINIALQAIWQDRDRIVKEVSDAGLRGWFQQRQAKGLGLAAGAPVTLYQADGIFTLAFSPDGKHLATGATCRSGNCAGGEIMLWDIAEGGKTPLAGDYHNTVLSLAWSPDGTRLAGGACTQHTGPQCLYSDVRVWDIKTGQAVGAVSDAAGWPYDLEFSSDGNLLATTNASEIFLWNAVSGQTTLNLAAAAEIFDVAFSPDSTMIAAPVNDEIWIWDTASGKQVQTLAGHPGLISRIAWSPSRTIAAITCSAAGDSGCTASEIWLWDTTGDKPKKTIPMDTAGVIEFTGDLVWSPEGSSLLTAACLDQECTTGRITLWDAESGKQIGSYAGTAWKATFSPDGQRLAIAFTDGIAVLMESSDLRDKP